MDRIFIRNLTVDAIIGIYETERIHRQRVTLDLEMSANVAQAASSENIAAALNYKTVADTVTEYVQNSQFQLVETLAEHIVDIVRRDFGVQWVKLTLHKPDALDGDTDVGVIIERGQSPQSALADAPAI